MINLIRGKRVRLQIWDTAGQEKFNAITQNYYRNCDGIFLVYDVTNENSFNNVSNWLRNIQKYADDDVEKMVIGELYLLFEVYQSTAEVFLKYPYLLFCKLFPLC